MPWPAHRRLMGTPPSSPAPAGNEAAAAAATAGRGSSQDSMKIMVSVLVVVIFCTLFYCIYCWRWRKRNDASKSAQLDWKTRHSIILGIARGLLYLHEDSLLKVVHRDLKASNVLLDNKMNPKISDFGMAKIFEDECNEVNTGRVVGTYGYMAPEFVMDGVFSVKSDVFSFGVLLVEILGGKRNGALYLEEHEQTLIQDAWKLWTEDKAPEFMDPALGRSYSKDEAWRCYHVGLLCVQDDPDLRPTMSTVLLMLISDHMNLPAPARPPLFTRLRTFPASMIPFSTKSESTYSPQSINDVSITVVEPR